MSDYPYIDQLFTKRLEELVPEARCLLPFLLRLCKAARHFDINEIEERLDDINDRYRAPSWDDIKSHHDVYLIEVRKLASWKQRELFNTMEFQKQWSPELAPYCKILEDEMKRPVRKKRSPNKPKPVDPDFQMGELI